MTYSVFLTQEALEDFRRLEDFLIDSALKRGDLDLPGRAVAAIRSELRLLETNPFTCRIAEEDRFERELVIPFGASGYVALFRIIDDEQVAIAAIRHHREDDYR